MLKRYRAQPGTCTDQQTNYPQQGFLNTLRPFFPPINLVIPKITLILSPAFIFSPNHLIINHIQPQTPLPSSHNKSHKCTGSDPSQTLPARESHSGVFPCQWGWGSPRTALGTTGLVLMALTGMFGLPWFLPFPVLIRVCGDEIFVGKGTISASINRLFAPMLVGLH